MCLSAPLPLANSAPPTTRALASMILTRALRRSCMLCVVALLVSVCRAPSGQGPSLLSARAEEMAPCLPSPPPPVHPDACPGGPHPRGEAPAHRRLGRAAEEDARRDCPHLCDRAWAAGGGYAADPAAAAAAEPAVSQRPGTGAGGAPPRRRPLLLCRPPWRLSPAGS